MKTTTRWVIPWMTAVAVTGLGCTQEEPKPDAATAHSAPSKPAPAPSVTPPPAPTVTTPPVDCPKGSTGEGSFDKPCEATGAERMMTVTWTKKIDDQGPKFEIISKSTLPILHGKVVVYYYDKAGKQIEIPAKEGSNAKPKLFHTCSGSIFAGVVKPEEKIYMYFSCAKKDRVPEGTKTIEAEIQTVGFADPTDDKRVSYYWRNNELTPDERPKGGVKAKKK